MAVFVAGCSSFGPAIAPNASSVASHPAHTGTQSFLYVANAARRGTVTIYRTGGKKRQATVQTGPAFAGSIVVDASGRLYVPYWGGISVFSGRDRNHMDR